MDKSSVFFSWLILIDVEGHCKFLRPLWVSIWHSTFDDSPDLISIRVLESFEDGHFSDTKLNQWRQWFSSAPPKARSYWEGTQKVQCKLEWMSPSPLSITQSPPHWAPPQVAVDVFNHEWTDLVLSFIKKANWMNCSECYIMPSVHWCTPSLRYLGSETDDHHRNPNMNTEIIKMGN